MGEDGQEQSNPIALLIQAATSGKTSSVGVLVIALALGGGGWFGHGELDSLNEDVERLEQYIAETNSARDRDREQLQAVERKLERVLGILEARRMVGVIGNEGEGDNG